MAGAGGMGKTRLLRTVEEEARRSGFQVLWGNGVKEAIGPFFVFQQVFRRSAGSEEVPGGQQAPTDRGELPTLLLVEEERPARFRSCLAGLQEGSDVLLISRENVSALPERTRFLPRGARALWVTRLEGEGRLSPGNLDALGEAVSDHLRSHPGGIVGLDAIEYLTSQNSFPAVLRLLQFLRDVAQEQGAHLLVALRASSFEKREVSLLESDAEVLRSPLPGEATSGASGAGAAPEPPSQTLLRYLGLLEEISHRSPVLLVVDDLHWVDALSGTAFQFLCRNARDLPVVILGGAREEEVPVRSADSGPSLSERLEILAGEGLLTRLSLRPFGEEEASTLAREVLGAPLVRRGEELGILLHRTEGNPYFLRETFLQVREEGGLKASPEGLEWVRGSGGGAGEALSGVPTSLQRLVHRRLEHLSAEERAFLDTAAVAGSEFDLEPVGRLRGLTRERARALAHRLERQDRLIEASPSELGTDWSFAHPLVWEVVRSEMGPATLQREARSLFQWWAEHRPDEVATVARLAHDGGEREQGLPWVERALEESLHRLAPEAASTYLRWSHDLRRAQGRAPAAEEVVQEARRARQVGKAGASRSAAAFLEGLEREGLAPELSWQVEYELARTLQDYDAQALTRVVDRLERRAADPSGSPPPPPIRHGIEMLRAFTVFQTGRYADALPMYEEVLRAPASEVEPEVRFRCLSDAAWGYLSRGDRERTVQVLAEAEEAAQGDVGLLAQVRHVEGRVVSYTGDLLGGARKAQEAARLFREAGNLSAAGIDEYNAAALLLAAGHLEEAEPAGRQLYDLGEKFDLPRIRSSGAYILARWALKAERHAEALEWVDRATRDAQRAHRGDDMIDCRSLRAEILSAAGELERSLAEYAALDAEGVFADQVRASNGLLIYAQTLEKHGDRSKGLETAERVLAAARALHYGPSIEEAQGIIGRLSQPPRAAE